MAGNSLFTTSLNDLIPQDHPKKVILDKLPWDELTEIAQKAYKSDYWQDKPNSRVMIGLFVWHCLSGDKTYREIADDFTLNSMCSYACGFKETGFRQIDNSTLVKFEENLGEENILEIKDIIEKASVNNQPPNAKGRHSGDTTVVESNVTFPTDTKLMESVRLFLVNDIIKLYGKELGKEYRIYNLVARRQYLDFAKKKVSVKKQLQGAKKKQLQFLKRNIKQAEEVLDLMKNKTVESKNGGTNLFGENMLELAGKKNKKALKRLEAKLETAKDIYRQQLDLYYGRKLEKGRIVSFHRPNVRPIFRGKAKRKTEFGVKVFLGAIGRAMVLSKHSYENFHDGKGYSESISDMEEKGYRIKEVIGDKGMSGMCSFLKEKNIKDGIEKRGKRKSPPPIPKNRFVQSRNKMEGEIGTWKRKFIKAGMRAKTDFGDIKKIAKSVIGYNLQYAF